MANNNTYAGYERLFEKLVDDYVGDAPPTARRLSRALKAKSEEGMSKDYYYRLKSACKAVLEHRGYPDEAAKLQDIAKWSDKAQEAKHNRKVCKRISDDDYRKLLQAARPVNEAEATQEDWALYSSIMVSRVTGMRPEEIYNAKMDASGNIFIEGAKKSEKLKRGADRIIHVKTDNPESIDLLQRALASAQSKPKGVIQSAMNRLSNKVFPRRKLKPSLKTFRHQLGSELKAMIKAGEIDQKVAANMLGHQSADSMDKYGNIKMSGGLGVLVESGLKGIGIDHNEVGQVRTPSADLQAAIDDLTPAQKMESDNVYATARESITPAQEKNNSLQKNRGYSNDSPSLG